VLRLSFALLFAALAPTLACGGGEVPFDVGAFRSDDFPGGDGFLFGVVLDERTGAGLEGLAVTITPRDGLPLAEEVASPVQAETVTNRRGEFTFNGVAPGAYVLFVRFDGGHLGYGEVVQQAQAAVRPTEVRVFPTPLNVRFGKPRDGGIVAPADTALLLFSQLQIDQLITLTPESRPLHARVTASNGQAGPPAESDVGLGARPGFGPPGAAPAGSPLVFEVELDDRALERGEVRVPLQAGGLPDPVRLESSLGFHVVYRDPRGGPPQDREIRGQAISVATP
jgi:hypothetical protein